MTTIYEPLNERDDPSLEILNKVLSTENTDLDLRRLLLVDHLPVIDKTSPDVPQVLLTVCKRSATIIIIYYCLLLLLFITLKQHDIQTTDITILHKENTNHANIKQKT